MPLVSVISVLAVAACGESPGSAVVEAPRAPYSIVDLADDFTEFVDETAGMEPAARALKFRGKFNTLFPGFYDAARFDGMTEDRYDAQITRSLERFPAIRPAYTLAAGKFPASFAAAHAAFMNAFPDMRELGEIFLLHSLGEMDGGTRRFGGRNHFIFGADVMAQVHDLSDQQPFIQHEIFHVYHQRNFDECGLVWCALWAEGLAVYIADRLNPDASDDQLLLTRPEPVREPVDAHMTEAVCAVRGLLDSRSEEDFAALFGNRQLGPNPPPRFGYYVGYLAAREAGRTRPDRELARLANAEARVVLETAMSQLADCARL